MQIKVKLHDRQFQYFTDNHIKRAYVGGRGAGKSHVGTLDVLLRAKPNRMYGVYAPTYLMLRDATVRTLTANAKEIKVYKDFNKSSYTMYLNNGAEIICRSLNDPEHARGPNLSGAYFDEASILKSNEAFNIVIACLREGGEQGFISATFTPKGKKHWTYEQFGVEDSKTRCFFSKTADNPFLPKGFVDVLRSQYTSRRAAQELDAQFTDPIGKLFQRSWFKVVDDYPRNAAFCRFWDMAATEVLEEGQDPDYTAGCLIGFEKGRWYIIDMKRDRKSPFEVEQLIQQTAILDGYDKAIRIEQEGGSAGKTVMDYYGRHVLAGWNFKGVPSTGSKAQRADPIAAAAENGNVYIVKGKWNEDFLDEIECFPTDSKNEHDDQIDAMSGAFNFLSLQFIQPSLSSNPSNTPVGVQMEKIDSNISELMSGLTTDEARLAAWKVMKEAGLI